MKNYVGLRTRGCKSVIWKIVKEIIVVDSTVILTLCCLEIDFLHADSQI